MRFITRWAGLFVLAGSTACGSGSTASDERAATDDGEAVAEQTSELFAAAGDPLAVGTQHTCVILEGGSVKCFGLGAAGQLGYGDTTSRGATASTLGNALPIVQLGRGLTAKAIVAGQGHTCALLSNNLVKCWGDAGFGQLGLGSTVDRGVTAGQMGDDLPTVDLGTARTVKALAAGGTFNCAILDTNQVKCWGANSDGQLGTGDSRNRGAKPGEMGDSLPPVFLGTGRTATSIVAGGNFACAILDDGTTKCWGNNDAGQLGQGSTTTIGNLPDQMATLPAINLGTGLKAKALSAAIGYLSVCALIEGANQIKCWGANDTGQLGIGATGHRGDQAGEMGDNLPFVNLGSSITAKAVAVGEFATCALLDTPNPPAGAVNTNQVKCWGSNSFGQLGLGLPTSTVIGLTPASMGDNLPLVAMGPGRSARAIKANQHVCVVLDTNQVKCWGHSGNGQLGNGLGPVGDIGDDPAEMGPNLVAVNLGSRASSIATLGANFACARLADGQVKCWGENNQGQLGLGDTVARGATAASLGNNLPTVPLGAGRSVYAGAGNVLEAGTAHVCAVLDNRRVKCWGNGLDGRLGQGATTPLGNTLATTGDSLPYVDLGAGLLTMQLSSGSAHTCALLSTKQIKCWGRNNNGCLGLGDTQAHGDVATEMGANLPFVDLGAGQTVVSVGAGVNHTCALLTGGTVKCWGLGQVLGYGTINDRGSAAGQMGASLPTIDLGTGLTAKTLSVGGNHTCAVLSNNQVKCWGYNIVGQLGLGDTNDRGDTANEMGDNLPIIPLGAGRTAKAVVAGSLSTCVLLDTNQIKCWGINDSGQLGLGDAQNRDTPSELGDFLPTPFLGSGRTVSSLVVGAVGSSSCALLDTRQLKCWGANASGQLGVGSTLTLGDGPNEMGDNLPFVDLGSEL